jgi:hypothetical protein
MLLLTQLVVKGIHNITTVHASMHVCVRVLCKTKRSTAREYRFQTIDGYIVFISLKLLSFVIILQDLRLERQINHFQRQIKCFSKKYRGHSTLSRKLRESMRGAHTLSRTCEKSSQVLAHTFSQSHTFSQFERKCVDAPHTFSQITRKRAIARKRGLTFVSHITFNIYTVCV